MTRPVNLNRTTTTPFVSDIEVGSMRHRITIQEKNLVDDGQGGFTNTWSDVATVWASIKEAKASEKLWAERLEQNITHRMAIRYRANLSTDMQIIYDGRTFQLHGIQDPDEKKHWLILKVEEGVRA